jgi:uncharacterized protein YhaN
VKIVGWHVDGFGTLRDYDVDGLGDGVTLISGENEAGKSTLLGFLRAMLFGFPKKSTRARQYPPLRGGGHGGQIIVSDNDGRTWTIARNADRKDGLSVTGAGGVTADEAQLRHLLGGADEKLFNSVFAFDLGELTGFDSLDAGGIRERIFSAGITGAGRSARRVIDELDKGADGLLKQGAGKAQINNLVRALEAVDADLRTARERDERYLELGAQERDIAGELDRLSPELERLRQRKALLEALVQSRPEWHERTRLLNELSALPSTTDTALPQRVAELVVELTRQRTREEQLAGLETNVTRMHARRGEALQRLGTDWTIERALAFDDSIAVRDEVRSWGTRLAALETRPAAAPAFGRRPLLVAVALAAACAVAAAALFIAGLAQLGGGLLAASVLLAVVGGVAVASRRGDTVDNEQQTRDGWLAWLKTRDLDEITTPAGFGDLLAAIGETREADRVTGDAERQLADIHRRAAEWDVLARGELAAAERPAEAFAAEDLRAALSTLDADLQRRARIVQRSAEIDASLNARFHGDKSALDELEGADAENWGTEGESVAAGMAVLEARRGDGFEEIGRRRKELEDIAQSDLIAELQTQRESLKAELAAKVHEYRVLVIARGLIRDTLHTYVRLHQPEVLGVAGSMFTTITGGRYVGVEAAGGDEGSEIEALVTVSRDGERHTPDQLSRGTAEQLYLAVRLALAADFTGRSTSLPVIVDDCLVNFDPQRQRGIAQALADYARERQLLLFTCHPETERIFSEVLGDRLTILGLPPLAG